MLDNFFKLSEHGTTVRTEVIAGATTFLTMAYIIFVNPQILSTTGMDQSFMYGVMRMNGGSQFIAAPLPCGVTETAIL